VYISIRRHAGLMTARGVVVRKRGGTPFRQIFCSRNGSPANIVANHVVLVRLTLDQFIFWPKLPPNAGFCIKNLREKISGGDTPEPPQREGGDPLPHSLPARLQAVRGAQAPPLLGPRSRKPFPKIRIYHYTPDDGTPTPCQAVLVYLSRGTHV